MADNTVFLCFKSGATKESLLPSLSPLVAVVAGEFELSLVLITNSLLALPTHAIIFIISDRRWPFRIRIGHPPLQVNTTHFGVVVVVELAK